MHFGTLNTAILLFYLAGMVGIGAWFSRRQRSGEDYFLAGRRVPWLVVAMSMYASLTSAVTYMGLPGIAYQSNIALVVVCFVSPILAPVLVYVFYPFYRQLGVTTSYEYIDKRFGPRARLSVSGLFLLARLGWLGTVIYAPALALSAVTGIDLWLALLAMGILATLYTVLGGLSAVVWTDAVQFVILVGGAVWLALSLVQGVPGGLDQILEIARATDHLNINWSVSWVEMTVLGVAVSFFFQMMQDYGTDQVTVQRLLSTRTYRGMIKAVFFNACVDFFIIGTLLFIGIGLFAYFYSMPDPAVTELSKDQVLPYYVMHALPNGISGLLIAAIFAAAMSSMDSGINSMATVVVNDFVRPFRQASLSGHEEVRLARWLTVALGAFATIVAFYISNLEGIIEAFATFMSLFSAPVLALFLLGMLTLRGSFPAWCLATLVSIPLTYWLQTETEANWVTYFPFSFLVTFSLAWLMSMIRPGSQVDAMLTLRGRPDYEDGNTTSTD